MTSSVARAHNSIVGKLDGQPAPSDDDEHTGGMVALLPDTETTGNLAVDGGEDRAILHLTLCYLGDDVTGWSPEQRDQVLDRARMAATWTAPIDARAFAHATFNPDAYADREPCAVYIIGGSDRIAELNQELRGLASALQHPGFVPHITAGYGMRAEDLTYTGPARFDRLVVALADDWITVPLTGDRRDLEPIPR